MKTLTLISLVSLLFATAAQAAPAPADNLPFPGAKGMVEKIKEGFVVKKRTFDDPSFDFIVAVPAEWGRVMAPFDLKKLAQAPQTLALYRSASLPTAEIEVQVFPLGREAPATDWLEQVITSLGAKKLHVKVHKGADPVPDVLVERVLDGKRFIFRMAAYKNGDRVYLLSARVAEAAYVANAEIFAAAVVSFDLVKPQDKKYAEPLRDYPVAQPFAGTVKMLASWQGEMTGGADLATGTFKWSVGKEVIGAIGVKLYPPSDKKPADFDAAFQEDVKQLGVKLAAPTTDTPLAAADGRLGGHFRVFPGTRDGRGVEMREYVIKYASGWAVLTLITPDAETNLGALVINRRAFSIAALELAAK